LFQPCLNTPQRSPPWWRRTANTCKPTCLPCCRWRARTARAYLAHACERAALGEVLEWHVFSGTALCGSIRLKDIDAADRKAKIGYYLGRPFQGRGIASAAVRAVLAHAFGALRLHRIELQCAAGNLASMALAGGWDSRTKACCGRRNGCMARSSTCMSMLCCRPISGRIEPLAGAVACGDLAAMFTSAYN
jgi:hypothetical protein